MFQKKKLYKSPKLSLKRKKKGNKMEKAPYYTYKLITLCMYVLYYFSKT